MVNHFMGIVRSQVGDVCTRPIQCLRTQFSANVRVRRVCAAVRRCCCRRRHWYRHRHRHCHRSEYKVVFMHTNARNKKNLIHVLVRCGLELQFHVQFGKAKHKTLFAGEGGQRCSELKMESSRWSARVCIGANVFLYISFFLWYLMYGKM